MEVGCALSLVGRNGLFRKGLRRRGVHVNVELREGELETVPGKLREEAAVHVEVEIPVIFGRCPCPDYQIYAAVGKLVETDKGGAIGLGRLTGAGIDAIADLIL